jgi:type IV pilus assembly protein PilV
LLLASNLLNAQGTVQVTPILPLTADAAAMQVTVQLQWNDRGQGQRLRTIAFQTQIVPE